MDKTSVFPTPRPSPTEILENRLQCLRERLDYIHEQEQKLRMNKDELLQDILSTRRRIHRLNQGTD